MKVTRKEYDEAKDKATKLKEKLKEIQEVVDLWERSARDYGKPREGDEIVAFIVSPDGGVDAITRRNGNGQPK